MTLTAAEILADRAAYYQHRARTFRYQPHVAADSHWIATQLHHLARKEQEAR